MSDSRSVVLFKSTLITILVLPLPCSLEKAMQGMQSRKAFSPQQTAPYSLLERNIFSLEISKIHWKKTRLLKLRLNISEHKDRGAVNLSNMKSAPYSAKEGDPLVKRWQLSHSSAWYLVE